MNRFDLEEQIQACWNTKDDIDLLIESIISNRFSHDQLCDALSGLSQIHEMRCQRAFDTFATLVRSGDIVSPETDNILAE
jgi:hypothetical protein